MAIRSNRMVAGPALAKPTGSKFKGPRRVIAARVFVYAYRAGPATGS